GDTFFFSSRRRHTRSKRDWSSDVCSSDLDTTKCILCAACTTSCPVFWADEEYFGPAAIVNAHRFIFDSRDHGAAQRLTVLNDKRSEERRVGKEWGWGRGPRGGKEGHGDRS